MPIYKNEAGQKIAVYAFDPSTAVGSDPSKTGDAANITARISKDGGPSAATNDVNPTELDATHHPGIYLFDLTQAETNADTIVLSPISATAGILLDPVVIYTSERVGNVPGSEPVSFAIEDEDGNPIEGLRLDLRDVSGNVAARGDSIADGTVPEIESLNPATYTPHAHESGLWQLVAGQTLVVTEGGANAFTVVMEALSIPTSPAGSLTLYAEVKKVNTAGDGLEPSGAGVVLRLQVLNGPDGVAAPGTVLVATTGSDSIAAFTGIPYGSTYEVWHGTATTKKKKGIAPSSGASDTIPFVVGSA